MPVSPPPPRISDIRPLWAIEGGRVRIEGAGFLRESDLPAEVRLGSAEARVVRVSATALTVQVPAGLPGGPTTVRIGTGTGETAYVDIGAPIATGLHQVDNPAFDHDGNLYVTYSGTRGQRAPVTIFRVRPDGAREPFVSDIANPTSMAVGRDGHLYVTSRFEGTVHRVDPSGQVETFATDLGVPCGLAFGADGRLFVGDRSGTIFRLSPSGAAVALATLPPSVAAFHLACGPDECLYVAGPTLSSCDSLYRIDPSGRAEVVYHGFGRPQGLAFDAQGALYVVDALAGQAGLYRLDGSGRLEQVVAAASLVGVALDPRGGLVVASNETAYRLNVALRARAAG